MSRDLSERSAERRVREAIGRWRNELINLTRANRLLYFRHTRAASLEITAPGSDDIVEHLDRGRHWTFFSPPVDSDGEPLPEPYRPGRTELVTDKRLPNELQSSLRALERRALDTFNERGLWTLYLGLGCLSWTDPADGKPAETPLLLYPVRFNRTSMSDDFRLWASDEDVVVNPALAVKLANDFGIDLPALDDLDDQSPAAVRDAVEAAVAGRAGWRVTDRCVLHPFAFAKEAMYRDLLDNEEAVAAHPIVRTLALGGDAGAELSFDPPSIDTLDELAPPEALSHVLDADSSQRRCVVAAMQGHSFVMDGPPGTGKSQTITNIIAELLHDGRSVLFVSEKAAALDVVESRLQDRGLAPFILELHSHKASRKEVAKALGAAFTQRPRATEHAVDTIRARHARERLTGYAEAVSEPRADLARSVASIIGRLVHLREAPDVPMPEPVDRPWDAAFVADVVDHAGRLARAWGPVERGDDFVWRDVRDPARATRRVAEIEATAITAERAGIELADVQQSVVDELGLMRCDGPAAAGRVAQLLDLLDHRVEVPLQWLTDDTLDEVAEAAATNRAASHVLDQLVERLHGEAGPRWRDIDPEESAALQRVRDELRATWFGLTLPGDVDRAVLDDLKSALDATAAMLHESIEDADILVAAFGARTAVDLGRLEELARLASLIGSPHTPEPTWLDPSITHLLRPAQAALAAATADAKTRAETLRDIFRPDVVDLDLRALRARFKDVHKGLRKLGGAYRADKRTLAAAVVSGKVTPAVIARLDDAIAYQDALAELQREEANHAGVLGARYYHGVDTDFGAVEAAIEVASEAVRLARGEIPADVLRGRLTKGAPPDDVLRAAGTRMLERFESWAAHVGPRLRADRPAVQQLTSEQLAHACASASSLVAELNTLLTRMADVARRPLDLAAAQRVTAWRADVAAQEARFARDEPLLDARFGPLHSGANTDWDAVYRALDWVEQLRSVLEGSVTTPVARSLLATTLTRSMVQPALDEWQRAEEALLAHFSSQRAESYRQELAPSWDDALRLLSALAATASDIVEWSAHVDEVAWFEAAGFGRAVASCRANGIAARDLPPALERAVLAAWTAEIIATDPRLAASRSVDLDSVAEDFRTLDSGVIDAAAARIVNAAASRLPTTRIGESAVISKEAQKQRRHMPIRELFRQAGSTAQRLKPVFMMSPLAVSTYLPPTMMFDAVIFDEASQVRPSDAINCLYRARQVIVAGDERQLPPTSFFDTAIDDATEVWAEDDPDTFESVLDLCKSSTSVVSLPLTWHYRSRHESLIAFSNHAFYDDMLATFPSARHLGDDVGIEVFKVDGVYDRGGRRTNEVEARRVVDRVLFHQREHPKLSLGVVAFSASQQAEILAQLEAAASDHPELNDLVGEDRLHGFFVKNLENVQGDERDIIVFSIGYGPDATGKVTLNLGPVSSRTGGWRRLNVAITRARRRVEIVTSILPSDLERADNPSLVHLRNYLDFALRGRPLTRGGDADQSGVLGAEIASIVRRWGYDVDERVGMGDYRVDLAVHHPQRHGEYVLAIECDEPDYARTRIARDRDRLRPAVLEGLGWHRHHVWSTAWHLDRPGEERRLRDAINSAISGGPARASSLRRRPEPVVVNHETVEDGERPDWVVDYEPASVRLQRAIREPIDDPRNRAALLEVVHQVVSAEGPVHVDVVLDRMRPFLPVARIGSQIKATIEQVIRARVSVGKLEREGAFLRLPGTAVEVVRRGSEDVPFSIRRPAHVPSEEIDLAVISTLTDAGTVELDELLVYVSRAFGWRRLGADIRRALDASVERLIAAEAVELVGERSVRVVE